MFNPNNQSEIFKWCLDRIEDTNGNFIEITYTKSPDSDPDEWETYIDTISYTGNMGLFPKKNVIFHYEDRDDVIISFLPKFKTKIAHRLKAIEVKAQNQFVWGYRLCYGLSGSSEKSLLKKVQIYGNENAQPSDLYGEGIYYEYDELGRIKRIIKIPSN